MKTFSYYVLFIALLFTFCACGRSSDDGDPRNDVSSLKAAISMDTICTSTINFRDADGNVYAYRADDIFGKPSVQTGGHSTPDQTTDLGVNIFPFVPFEANIFGTFQIDHASTDQGTAYVFYIDGMGNQYISTDNNTSVLTVTDIDIAEDGETINSFTIVFNNVEVANNYDAEDIRCINAFELTFFSDEN